MNLTQLHYGSVLCVVGYLFMRFKERSLISKKLKVCTVPQIYFSTNYLARRNAGMYNTPKHTPQQTYAKRTKKEENVSDLTFLTFV